VAMALTAAIFCLVAFLAVTHRDEQSVNPVPRAGTGVPAPAADPSPGRRGA
jgi:hypothetical protein